jgi:hypothetical protein
MSEIGREAGLSSVRDKKCIMSLTISRELKLHKGSGARYGDTANSSTGGMVSFTVTEAAPGSYSPEELYDKVVGVLDPVFSLQGMDVKDIQDTLTAGWGDGTAKG